jgi:hypothetical protein
MVKLALRILLMGGALYLGLCLLMWVGQRRLMYFPERATREEDTARARFVGLRPWLDPAGALLGWRGGEGPRILLLHGNAGKALHRAYWLPMLQDAFGQRPFELLLLEYPGYGARPGSPSQEHLLTAATQALDALWAERPEPVLVLGESLGSGVAALLAAQRPGRLRGLLLVTPLPSMREVARVHYPYFPAFLVRDAYPARAALGGLRLPLALILAERDEVIPSALGRSVSDGYAGPVRAWVEAGATHNTLHLDGKQGVLKDALGFLESPNAKNP